MKYRPLAITAILGLASCGTQGRRFAEAPVIRPNEVADFRVLYGQNCSGCHGMNGEGGLSVGIGSPVYLAIADDATIRRVIQAGRPGTAMPAFAQKAGGLLTDTQVDILVQGIRDRWARPDTLGKDKPPAYASSNPGDAARGQNVFLTFCSSCHGQDGRGGKRGSIADSSYLALVSDQHLRTVTITGMPSLGAPDWRGNVPGKPLSDADVTDVVAWLVTQRTPLLSQSIPKGGSE